MEIKIVLGLLFGDEGKGNTVQWLCKKALKEGKKPCVVRFSGGPQAGHTVRHNGITHVCSSYGSGVLLGVPTLYIGGLVDPLCIENERKALEAKGITVPPLYLKRNLPLITPYDVADQLEWSKDHPNRTCGKGVMSTVKRGSIVSSTLIYSAVSTTQGEEWIEAGCRMIKVYYEKYNPSIVDSVSAEILSDWKKAALNVGSNVILDNLSELGFDVLIFEGTQGLLLDSEYGFYPYVTSTKVGLNGIPEECLKDAEVYLVTRTYLTRHGEMGNVEKKWFKGRGKKIPADKLETNVFNEHQGEFHTAMYLPTPYRYAVQRHCLDNMQKRYNLKMNLVVTHTDVDYSEEDIVFPKGDCSFFINGISRVLEEFLVLQNIYISNNPDSNFELYDTRIN